jgi:hypothetical protein
MSFKILAIIYCEFNLEKGPELVYQEPENYIKESEFPKISEFIVPSTQFCNKEIALHLGNAYLLGYPIFLNNSNYERNRFKFNFCLMIDEEEYEYNNYLYDCLIKKINITFENLEIDYDFNFIKKNMDMVIKFIKDLFLDIKEKQYIIDIHIETDNDFDLEPKLYSLEKVKSVEFSKSRKDNLIINNNNKRGNLQLEKSYNSTKEIFMPEYQKSSFNEINKKPKIKKRINFSFRYIDFNNIKIKIENYFVPIWIKELDNKEIKKLDTINLKIINNINGINSVHKIAKNVSDELDLVKYALSSLYIIRGITFIDIFHDSNIYKPTTELKKLKIEGLLTKFQKFCKMNKDDNQYEKNSENESNIEYMDDNKLFSYYVLLANSKNIKSFRDKLKTVEFNMNLFVGFGVYLGIIRRIHLYFYYIENRQKSIENTDKTDIFSLMDGKHCEDEISIEKGISVETLYEKYKDSDFQCYYLYK